MVLNSDVEKKNEMIERFFNDHPYTKTLNIIGFNGHGRIVSMDSEPHICKINVQVTLIDRHLELLHDRDISDKLLNYDHFLPTKFILD